MSKDEYRKRKLKKIKIQSIFFNIKDYIPIILTITEKFKGNNHKIKKKIKIFKTKKQSKEIEILNQIAGVQYALRFILENLINRFLIFVY